MTDLNVFRSRGLFKYFFKILVTNIFFSLFQLKSYEEDWQRSLQTLYGHHLYSRRRERRKRRKICT